MKNFHASAAACLFLLHLILVPSLVLASEKCSLFGGACRDACGPNERAEAGAFEDCGERQECCVVHDAAQDTVRCCVYSFDRQNFGPGNCGAPENNVCSKGAATPVACKELTMCK